MTENKKYVELIWHQKYDDLDKGQKMPIEKPNLPFQVTRSLPPGYTQFKGFEE